MLIKIALSSHFTSKFYFALSHFARNNPVLVVFFSNDNDATSELVTVSVSSTTRIEIKYRIRLL